MRPEPFLPGVSNYYGHCIGAIAKSGISGQEKTELTKRLPTEISYDQYMGFVNIISSAQSRRAKFEQLNQLFGPVFQNKLLAMIDRFIRFLDIS